MTFAEIAKARRLEQQNSSSTNAAVKSWLLKKEDAKSRAKQDFTAQRFALAVQRWVDGYAGSDEVIAFCAANGIERK